uniref:Protein phosphatase inhibitor 2 n=1 Tax=Fagus sylvatica TaxID=28930 RepID=A0A2N9E7Z4_FAGSY
MKGRVRWDEANLIENEADKPVRQKICEPKTPFHPMIEEDGSPSPIPDSVASTGCAAHAEAIRNALNQAVSTQNHSAPLEGRVLSSEDEFDAMEEDEGFAKIRRELSFNSHRRAHYDEYLRVKKLKQKGCFVDDGDDEDNDAGSYNSSRMLSDGVRKIHIDGDDEILRTIDIQEGVDEGLPQ